MRVVRGYAAEAAASVCDAAREAGIEHLVAIIRPHNAGVARAWRRRIGMSLEREVDKRGPALVFGMEPGSLTLAAAGPNEPHPVAA